MESELTSPDDDERKRILLMDETRPLIHTAAMIVAEHLHYGDQWGLTGVSAQHVSRFASHYLYYKGDSHNTLTGIFREHMIGSYASGRYHCIDDVTSMMSFNFECVLS